MMLNLSLRACLAVAIATVSFSLLPAFAQVATQPAPPLPLAPDVAAIVERGKLVVAMTAFDSPPFYSGSGSHLEGIDVTLAERVAGALGVEVEFNRDAETFNDVVAKVALGDADLAISKISRTHARAQVVAFSEPYARLRHALIFNRLKLARIAEGRDIAEVVRHFEGSIGVIQNSSFATFAKERFPHATVVPFKTWEEVIDATIAGTVDASYRDEFEIRKVAVDRPDASISLRTVTINDASDSIAVAVPWDRPRLLGIVNQVIDERATQVTADELIALYRASSETEGEH